VAKSTSNVLVSDDYLEQLSQIAELLYQRSLKAVLEPEHTNEYVAIHVDSGDYCASPDYWAAKRTMLERHAVDGKLVIRRIGDEPEIDSLGYRCSGIDAKLPTQK